MGLGAYRPRSGRHWALISPGHIAPVFRSPYREARAGRDVELYRPHFQFHTVHLKPQTWMTLHKMAPCIH